MKRDDQKGECFELQQIVGCLLQCVSPIEATFCTVSNTPAIHSEGKFVLRSVFLSPVLVTRHIISIPQPASTFAVCSRVRVCVRVRGTKRASFQLFLLPLLSLTRGLEGIKH